MNTFLCLPSWIYLGKYSFELQLIRNRGEAILIYSLRSGGDEYEFWSNPLCYDSISDTLHSVEGIVTSKDLRSACAEMQKFIDTELAEYVKSSGIKFLTL